jgi:hypothetical protein
MTLANMRENGVRSLCVTCELCRHCAPMNVDAFGDAIPIPPAAALDARSARSKRLDVPRG